MTVKPLLRPTQDLFPPDQFMPRHFEPLLDRFTGYLIAPCGFQLANGLAIVGDAGIRNLAIEYLD
jgi:hypothetical protein